MHKYTHTHTHIDQEPEMVVVNRGRGPPKVGVGTRPSVEDYFSQTQHANGQTMLLALDKAFGPESKGAQIHSMDMCSLCFSPTYLLIHTVNY